METEREARAGHAAGAVSDFLNCHLSNPQVLCGDVIFDDPSDLASTSR